MRESTFTDEQMVKILPEAGVLLGGTQGAEPIARAWAWAEEIRSDPRAQALTPRVGGQVEEPFEPRFSRVLRAAMKRDPMIRTLWQGRPSRVAELTPIDVLGETKRFTSRTGGAEPTPAGMFNLAWERLRSFGELTKRQRYDGLRFHRSSAACAMRAHVLGVERAPGREIVLRGGRPQ